jgi:hypothetical protein
VLSRKSKGGTWEELTSFEASCTIYPSCPIVLYQDYTIEHEKTYIYGLQFKNQNNILSDYILSNSIKCEYEDMFLYDGQRQLNIKFNPKVSNFKNNILE